MKIKTIPFLFLLLLSFISVVGQPIKPKKTILFDKSRNREIPIAIYSNGKNQKQPVAIISHGYGGSNTAYSFIADQLVSLGYYVVSIQHELKSDAPMPTTGNIMDVRKPFWQRGADNIMYVISELKSTNKNLDLNKLLLVGHSNGGDMSMLFATEHPDLVDKLISLDNRRMPVPRTKNPRILYLKASDTEADPGVLPTGDEQEEFNISIVYLTDGKHNDLWDGAPSALKKEITEAIDSFLK